MFLIAEMSEFSVKLGGKYISYKTANGGFSSDLHCILHSYHVEIFDYENRVHSNYFVRGVTFV